MQKVKLGRNDPCFCGSGKKYKKCCATNPDRIASTERKSKIRRATKYEEGMVLACRLARRCMDEVEKMMKPGVTGVRVDAFVKEYLGNHNAVPATLNYQGFPSSCCISPNDVVCHGIPNDVPFAEGDIVNVDLTPILNGYHGDINRTFFIGECSAEAKKVVSVCRESLELGMESLKPYGHVGDIGAAISRYAHSQGCSVVEKYVGHGIGLRFHEDPQVPHFGREGEGPPLIPGMFFTIEPMINLGTKNVEVLEDKWTAVTADGRLSAQFEHTVMITENGYRVLTREADDDPVL